MKPRAHEEAARSFASRRTSPRQLAAIIWDLVRQSPPDGDLALLDAITQARPERLPFNGPARRNWTMVEVIQLGAAATSDGQATVLGLARWAQSGFPVVTMPATYAAALLATAVPGKGSHLTNLRAPFRAFLIEVSPTLLPVDNPEGGPDFVTRVLVFRHEHRRHPDGAWAYVAWTNRKVTLWRFGVNAEGLLPAELDTTALADEMASFPLEITDVDRRTKELLGRLIVNTCLAMTDPDNVRVKGSLYQVGRRLEVNLCDEVRAYGRGEARRAPELGGWVSSHWKMQPYGPGNALRKWIFVEPYWRGPVVVNVGHVHEGS